MIFKGQAHEILLFTPIVTRNLQVCIFVPGFLRPIILKISFILIFITEFVQSRPKHNNIGRKIRAEIFMSSLFTNQVCGGGGAKILKINQEAQLQIQNT
jgi:hypothetical protein